MRRGILYTCDRCGEKAQGAPPDEPPLRWLWAFGYEVHACSAACWSRVQKQHRAESGKVYITSSHEDDRTDEWADDLRPPAVDVPPARFTIREFAPPPPEVNPAPVVRRRPVEPHQRGRGEPRADAGTRREPVPPPPPRDFGGRRERLPTFLYFAQEGEDGPIKIGVSAAPLTRLSSLQVSNPRPLRILATRPGTGEDERRLHAELAQYRIRGEWFVPAPAVLSAVTGA